MKEKCIAIIPARGGSKRIPRKNIKLFHGKPLIAYSIEAALKSELFDKVIVTTDDEEIASVAKKYGAEVPFIRPKELSDDFTNTKDVIDHALEYFEERGEKYDYECTIYATAPLLQPKYLIEGFVALKNSDAINAFSCTSMPFPIWRTFKIDENQRCEMFWRENFPKRSQDLEEAYQDAGQFYWTKLGKKSDEIMFGKDSIPIILPRHLVQDIDTLEDWERAEFMHKALHQDIYDRWSDLKKMINKKEHKYFIKQGEIYFISIGQNIGFETYGKDELFLRPVLVFKKLNQYSFIGIPLTTKEKEGSFFFSFSYKQDNKSTAVLSQMKMFDIKRIAYRSGHINFEDFEKLKEKIGELFGITLSKEREATPLAKQETAK